MAILEWHENTTGRYISGVSHGVFFGDDGVPIPWNGLISVTEKFQTNEPTPIYNSLGGKYYQYGNVAEKRHSIVCYTYPEEMDEYLGTEYADHLGFVVDEKPPRIFDMAYRSDCDGYYQLHILFNQIATFGDKTHGTNTATPGISNITMNLQGAPNEAFGTSHVILDSRNPMTASVERVLFGTRNTDGNFENFLNADIQWVTKAINYAPTIEPDYDNRVWLGRENLSNLFSPPSNEVVDVTTLPGVTEYGNPILQATRLTAGNRYFVVDGGKAIVAKPGDYYTTWVEYEIIDNNGDDRHRAWLRLYSIGDPTPTSETIEHLGGNRYRNVFVWGPMGYDMDEIHLRSYLYIWPNRVDLIGATLNIRDYKVEKGDTPTPWTPYVNAPEHQPPSPVYNYVPGVKDASKWNATNVVPYWDEVTEQLALHSKSPEKWTQSKLSIPLDVSTPIDLKTSADINFGGMVDEPIFYSTNNPIDTSSYRVAAFVGDQPKENELVTISFRMDVPAGRTSINIYNSDGSYRIGGADVTREGQYTFTVPWKSVDVNNDYISIYPASSPEELNSYPGESTLYWITLEYGDVSTTYSPHPSNDLHRRIIGTSEPQVLSEQAPNVIGSQTVTLKSTVSANAQVDIYHNGPVGSDDVLVDNLIVTLQNYQGGFFDGNTVPKTRGERYRRVESTSGYYTVYEHLQIKTQSEVGVHTIGSDLYELYGPETQLSTDGDQFTFRGPQATSIGDDEFEIDDSIF